MRFFKGVSIWVLELTALAALFGVGASPRVLLESLSSLTQHPARAVTGYGTTWAVLTVLGIAGWAALLWLLLGTAAVTASQLPGFTGRLAARLAGVLIPATARRTLGGVLGATLAAGLVTPAVASAAPGSPPGISAHRLDWPVANPSASPRPDRPAATPTPRSKPGSPDAQPSSPKANAPSASPRPNYSSPRPRPNQPSSPPPRSASPSSPKAPSNAPGYVRVRQGDSLWKIAARELGPGASSHRIAETWPQWWHANRRVIGEDPGLISPGQHLYRPDADH